MSFAKQTSNELAEAVETMMRGLAVYQFPPRMAEDLALEATSFLREELQQAFDAKYPGVRKHHQELADAERESGQHEGIDTLATAMVAWPTKITRRPMLPTMWR